MRKGAFNTAVESTADGSVVIGVDMNVSDAEKELAKLKKKIEGIKAQIKKTSLKRDEANQKGILDAAELDAEKAKLYELEQTLKEIRTVAKDKSYSPSTREEAKSQIAGAEEAVKSQRERVRGLQAEYNKVAGSVERYDEKIKDLNTDLEAYKSSAGSLEQNIADENERFRKMAEDAGVASQRIIDLEKELSRLTDRQKELEGAKIGFGYKEYDENAAKIAEINREIKDYKKSLSGIGPETARSVDAPINRAVIAAQKMNSVVSKSKNLLKSVGIVGAKAFKIVENAILSASKKSVCLLRSLEYFRKTF